MTVAQKYERKIQELEQRITIVAENFGLTYFEILDKAKKAEKADDELAFVLWADYQAQLLREFLRIYGNAGR
jgi:hypothetical protein